MEVIRDLFRTFAGKGTDMTDIDIQSKKYIYCLVRIGTESDYNDSSIRSNVLPILSKVSDLATEAAADINQFCCGTALVLFSVPVEDERIEDHLSQFIAGLCRMGKSIAAILGTDTGLYGPFGGKDRQVVTALSARLTRDLHRVLSLDLGKILVSKRLANILHGHPKSSCLIVDDIS